MPSSLPPLNALRAFATAARLLSFKKASEELSVTPSAVSQQIKNLEDHLGVALFHRTTHGLEVTTEGKELLPSLEQAFADITQAVGQIKNENKEFLRVSAMPTFTASWLAPKLGEFHRRNPNIVVSLHSSLELIDLKKDDFDCAIRTYLFNDKPSDDEVFVVNGLKHERLFDSQLFGVYNPRRLKNRRGALSIPSNIEELSNFNLVHFRDYNTWTMWARYIGPTHLDTSSGIVCSDIQSMVYAIQDGQGIGVVDEDILNNSILGQNLEVIFPESVPGKMSFYLISPEEESSSDAAELFKKWLFASTQSIRGHYTFDLSRKAESANPQ
ncbi:transcriptional regulator GcvA [Aurantivibrio plasticivorans]